ncbi:hypothetical protein AKO1_012306 [Acrasis kona]|uniref:Uncharacterized protein n=1 Tax=Acrasis kona TaxID=1008807 RepID=A0AAW2YVR9_9EUKA
MAWFQYVGYVGQGFCGLIAIIHIYITILEMFLWRKLAPKSFGLPVHVVEASAPLAANQGIYNGALALGLIYGLLIQDVILLHFLALVIIAVGIFGGLTGSIKIIFVQVVPGVLAYIFLSVDYYAQIIYSLSNVISAAGILYVIGIVFIHTFIIFAIISGILIRKREQEAAINVDAQQSLITTPE